MIGIYRITNDRDGRFYIGSSRDINARFYGHKWLLRKNRHPNNHLQGAWNKYGEGAFTFDVLITLTGVTELRDTEQYYIDQLGALDRKKGYNISPRADCRAISPETAEKIGAANRGKFAKEGNPFWGKKHTEEFKEKMRQRRLGVFASSATRQKMSLKRQGEKHPSFGKRYTEEEKSRMSASMAKLKKPVRKLSLAGELLETFDSIKSVTRAYGYGHTTVSRACNGRIRCAYGYKWQFA